MAAYKRLTKLFGRHYKWKEIGDFGPAPEASCRMEEFFIDPSMAPIRGSFKLQPASHAKKFEETNNPHPNWKNILLTTLVFLSAYGVAIWAHYKRKGSHCLK